MFWYSQTEVPALNALGSWGLNYFCSCGLDSGMFTCTVAELTADHFLSPLSEGAAFVSQVSLGASSFLVELSDFGHLSSAAERTADQVQEYFGVLAVPKTSAEHLLISCASQAEGSQRIWDVAELLCASRVADTGNSALLGASGHCA